MLSHPSSFKGTLPARTLGHHLADRLVEVGVTDYFSVAGDFNLVLLDQFLENPQLNMIGCCNELNAGYAADGYARAKGIGCVVATFTVGGLSLLNAVAGAMSDDLPVIVIVGAPNSHDYGSNHILHHTTGIAGDYSLEWNCFKGATGVQVMINDLEHAVERIDHAISHAIINRKPAYISICANLAGLQHKSFSFSPVPFALPSRPSNPSSLESAVHSATLFLEKAVKPVILIGPKLRTGHAFNSVIDLATRSGFAVAVQPSAKGMFPESHPKFIGTYWGSVSTPFVGETIDTSDAILAVGCVFSDYTTVGWTALLSKSKMLNVDVRRVTVGGVSSYGCVEMDEFISTLSKAVTPNSTAWDNWERIVEVSTKYERNHSMQLRIRGLFEHIQKLLNSLGGTGALIVETGTSWFNGQKLKLPEGCGYEVQKQYGSIGWSVGALLGYAQATAGKKRVVAVIGDGSFQLTAQEVSTMIRYGQNNVIFLINNDGYTVEVEIHDGPYNKIKKWNYAALVEAFANGEGKVMAKQVSNEAQLEEAMWEVEKKPDYLCFIEVIVHRDDASRELLEFGNKVSIANGRTTAYIPSAVDS